MSLPTWDDVISGGSKGQSAWANAMINAIKRRGATKVVSNDEYGDYYCDGTADDVQMQEAFAAVEAAGGGSVSLKNTGTAYNIAAKLLAPTTTHFIFESNLAQIQKSAAMDYMFERTEPSKWKVLIVKDVYFDALYSATCGAVFNFQSDNLESPVHMENVIAKYVSTFLRLNGRVWNSTFKNCYVYGTQGAATWNDKSFIHMLNSGYSDTPKGNTFEDVYFNISDAAVGKLTVPAINLEGAGYNTFRKVEICGGYYDDALIKTVDGNYNTFEDCRFQDIQTDAYGGVGGLHIDAFNNIFRGCRLTQLGGKIAKFDTNSKDNLLIGNDYWGTGSINFSHANQEYLIHNFPKAGVTVSYTGTLTNKIITGNALIEHHTTTDTLTKAESRSIHTNLGAGANIKLTLPQDAIIGTNFEFAVMTAGQQLQVDPGAAGAIYINGAKQADDAYIWADDEGESVKLVADGNGDWIALYTQGTWTVV